MKLDKFCDIAMSQAKVWIPKMTAKEFEEIMMAKFYNREQSKEYVKEVEEDLLGGKSFKKLKDQVKRGEK